MQFKQEHDQLEASYHVTKRSSQLKLDFPTGSDVKLIFLSDKGSQIMNETVNRGTRTWDHFKSFDIYKTVHKSLGNTMHTGMDRQALL